jgi:HlyD family secretion protein
MPLRILAPVDGYVLNVYEESARVVTPSMPIMEVGDLQDLEAEIELLSSDAVGVAPGADVSIEHGVVSLRCVDVSVWLNQAPSRKFRHSGWKNNV